MFQHFRISIEPSPCYNALSEMKKPGAGPGGKRVDMAVGLGLKVLMGAWMVGANALEIPGQPVVFSENAGAARALVAVTIRDISIQEHFAGTHVHPNRLVDRNGEGSSPSGRTVLSGKQVFNGDNVGAEDDRSGGARDDQRQGQADTVGLISADVDHCQVNPKRNLGTKLIESGCTQANTGPVFAEQGLPREVGLVSSEAESDDKTDCASYANAYCPHGPIGRALRGLHGANVQLKIVIFAIFGLIGILASGAAGWLCADLDWRRSRYLPFGIMLAIGTPTIAITLMVLGASYAI